MKSILFLLIFGSAVSQAMPTSTEYSCDMTEIITGQLLIGSLYTVVVTQDGDAAVFTRAVSPGVRPALQYPLAGKSAWTFEYDHQGAAVHQSVVFNLVGRSQAGALKITTTPKQPGSTPRTQVYVCLQ